MPRSHSGPPGHPSASDHDHLRASDADRERVAEHLRDAMAEGRLDMAEFQERLDITYQARTYGELAPITRDLPSAAGGAGTGVAPVSMTKSPRPAGDPDGPNWPARIGAAPTSSGAFAFWGGFVRKGRWTISRVFTVFAMWGGGEIDLRDASFEDRDTTIRCFALMGGMQVTVPPGLNVDVTGIGVMGGFGGRHSFHEGGDPDAPRVKITGFALMGGVGVERKMTRAEKLRFKEQQQLLREENRLYRLESRESRRAEHRSRHEEHRSRHEEHRARRDADREYRRSVREDRRDDRR